MSRSGGKVALWQPREDEVIRKYYPDYKAVWRELPHRTPKAIEMRSSKIGVSRKFKVWTCAEKRRFTKMHKTGATHAELARQFGISVTAVMGQVYQLGIGRKILVNTKSDNPLVESVRGECLRQGIKFQALKRNIRAIGQFNAKGSKTSLKSVVRAVEYLGGELTIVWRLDREC